MPARKKPVPFEESLANLETLVEDLEAGELPLEEALKAFERGIRLTRECQQALQEAEQKVALLTEGKQGLEESPFIEDDGDL